MVVIYGFVIFIAQIAGKEKWLLEEVTADVFTSKKECTTCAAK